MNKVAACVALLALLVSSGAGAQPCINGLASKVFAPSFTLASHSGLTLAAAVSEYDAGALLLDPQVLVTWSYNSVGDSSVPVAWSLAGTLSWASLPALSATLGGTATDIVFSDVNADGRADLLLTVGPYLFYYQGFSGGRLGRMQNGNIEVAVPQQVITVATTATPSSFVSRPAIITLAGGQKGLLVAHSQGLTQWTFSAGVFSSPAALITGTAVEALAVLDLNGDGKEDVALVSGGQLQTRLSDVSGGFTVAASDTLLANADSRQVALQTADLDGDGRVDLLLNSSISQRWLVTASGLGATDNFTSPHGVLLADVDFDGDLDLLPKQGLASCGSVADVLDGWRNDGHGGFVQTPGNYADESMWRLAELNGVPPLEVLSQNVAVGTYTNTRDVDTSVTLGGVTSKNSGAQLLYQLRLGQQGASLAGESLQLTLRYPQAAWIEPDSVQHENYPLLSCPLVTPPDLAAGMLARECAVNPLTINQHVSQILLDRAAMEQQVVDVRLSLPQQVLDIDAANNRLLLRLGADQTPPVKKPTTLLGSEGPSLILLMLVLYCLRYTNDLKEIVKRKLLDC